MRQHPDPDPNDDEDDENLEELGTPVYQGTGLSVRALTAEELQRFLDAHAGQPAELLGSGWASLGPHRRADRRDRRAAGAPGPWPAHSSPR